MMALDFNFECVNKKHGWCIEKNCAGCEYDCEKMRCAYCIHVKQNRNRPPCLGCCIGAKEG